MNKPLLRGLLTLVLLYLSGFSGLTGTPRPQDEQSDSCDASGLSCQLVANWDISEGKPYVTFISEAEKPYPVIFDVSHADDSTIHASVFLPYTSPSRFPDPVWIDAPGGSVDLEVTFGSDTARFKVTCLKDSMTVEVTSTATRDFVAIAYIKDFPDDLLVFQMEGDSENLCREICQLLHGKARETVLESGFYRGLASLVCLDQLGGRCLNHTVQGRLLAVELERPLDDQTYSALESLAKSNGLQWFSTSADHY